MKIAVLSDARLPTRWDFAGHGLGKVALTIAEGLQQRGHEVYLWAAAGSQADVSGVRPYDNELTCPAHPANYDVMLDSTHDHLMQERYGSAKIVNLSQDRESNPGRCAVYSSEAHRDWHMARGAKRTGRVIHNGIDVPEPFTVAVQDSYYLYLATFYAAKGPVQAFNAARLAGVRLVMAGPTHEGVTPPAGAEYIGPFAGQDKFELLAGAKALIFPSAIECSPVTVLESLSVGTPVICSIYGGATCNMQHGVTGYACRDTLDTVDAIRKIDALNEVDYMALREQCAEWVKQHRNIPQMIDGYEAALKDCLEGQVW